MYVLLYKTLLLINVGTACHEMLLPCLPLVNCKVASLHTELNIALFAIS